MKLDSEVIDRATLHAALGEPVRLAIAEHLMVSDRSPQELQKMFGLNSNLLSHHLDVLESVGLIVRERSSGDGRRRYVHLIPSALVALGPAGGLSPQPVLFVCSKNSARSQLAAALWTAMLGEPSKSAGTHPAEAIHPGAIAAARRAGLDLSSAHPSALDAVRARPALIITVCDRAHEELMPGETWLHWSIADPIIAGTRSAFDDTVKELRDRIRTVTAA